MEALAFLKFWRNVGVGASSSGGGDALSTGTAEFPVLGLDDDGDDDGSFFELEFSVPGLRYEHEEDGRHGAKEESKGNGKRTVVNSYERRDKDSNVSLSAKDLFFNNNRVMPIEPSSSLKPQSPISLLRSPPKFRFFMSGLKRSRSHKPERPGKTEMNSFGTATPNSHQHKSSKLFTVKLKVRESPLTSMLTRANSCRVSDESKRLSRDRICRYLKLIKPPYVKVSRRYSRKTGLSETASSASPPMTASVRSPKTVAKKESDGNIPTGLRVVCKHLGKSRSTSAATATGVSIAASRSDDSLLLQHDGIESAILHCKRSLNASADSSDLSMSTTDPSRDLSIATARKSAEEQKAAGI